jgi:hypothetical protein
MIFNCIGYVVLNGKINVNNELGRVRKEAFIDYFNSTITIY